MAGEFLLLYVKHKDGSAPDLATCGIGAGSVRRKSQDEIELVVPLHGDIEPDVAIIKLSDLACICQKPAIIVRSGLLK